jgi:IS30 family transposase
MGKEYSHLIKEQRDKLFELKKTGISKDEIAAKLGCSRATVYRELDRNKCPTHHMYLPDTAEKLQELRRYRAGTKLVQAKELQQIIEKQLIEGWSPEVIAGRLKQEQSEYTISHESIYKFVYGEGKDLNWVQYLVRRKRQRGLRPTMKVDKIRIPGRVGIQDRPKDHEEGFGNWEGDTIIYAGHEGAIVTLYERKSKLLLGAKMTTKTTKETMDNIEIIFSRLPEKFKKSLTMDNGLEFYDHQRVNDKFGMSTYFCAPFASWQKGGVENANGIVRRWVPKKTRQEETSPEEIQAIFRRINSTPRKSLSFKTPYEVFLTEVSGKPMLLSLLRTNQPSVALRN